MHIPLLGTPLPDVSSKWIDNIIWLASLNILPMGMIYSNTLTLPVEYPKDMDSNFLKTGYSSRYFMLNAGSMFVYFCIDVILLVLLIVFLPCAKICQCCRARHDKYKKNLMFNPIIRMVLEASLDFSFAVFIMWTLVVTKDDENRNNPETQAFVMFNTYVVWTFLVIFSALPIFITIFLCCNFKRLKDKDFEDKYGAFYLGLNIDSRFSLIFPVQFVVRRFLFALMAVMIDFNWL